MEKNKKSVICEIGNHLGEECSLNTYNSNITELKLFKECTDNNPSLEKCPNATDQWLIQNRLKQTLLVNDVCPKHRMQYSLGWRSSQMSISSSQNNESKKM